MTDVKLAGSRSPVGAVPPTVFLAAAVRRALLGATLAAAYWVGAPALDLPSPVATAEAAEKKAKPPQLSKDVIKKLKPAQDAIQAGDNDTGIQSAREALAISATPYDKEMSLRIMMAGHAGKKDFPGYAAALEQLVELNPESLTPEDKLKFYKQLAQINFQEKNYAKVQQWSTRWAEAGGGSEAYEVLAASYLIQKDCQNGIGPLEKSVEGREPTENQLKQLNFCYYQNGTKPKREAVMESLAVRFPKREYFIDLMNLYQEQNADSRAVLNMYRLAFERDWLTRESDYLEYADMAIEVGAPAEAQAVIERATAKGALSRSERSERLRTQAKQLTAEDKRTIAQLDKEAKAGKNGEADVKVGMAYLGLGDYQKAADAIQRGLQPERVGKVKRVDDAYVMLGIALAKLGNQAEAAKAFEAAKADPRMAKAADLWMKLQTAAPAPAAPAPAAT